MSEQQMITQVTISTWGTTPRPIQVPRPPIPDASSPLVQIRLLASGLHTLVRLRATGTHYSASALPHIPGVDGVGLTVPDDQLVYFSIMMLPNGGSFAEYVNVPRAGTTPIITTSPSGGGGIKNPVQIAGLVNPAAASWMALATRVDLPISAAESERKGFSVLILGVTSLSGTVAISISRLFGATTVIGVGRSASKLQALAPDLDETIQLRLSSSSSSSGTTSPRDEEGEQEDTTEWTDSAREPDIILDFLYGPSTLSLFRALKPNKRIQYVQLGSSSGRPTIRDFPADIFRSKDLTVRGSGPGAWSMAQFAAEAPKIVAAVASGAVKEFPGFKEARLADVQAIWEGGKSSSGGGERIVFVP